MTPNVPAYLVGILGTLRAGHIVVNVNLLYKPDELQRQLLDRGAQAIVIFETFAHILQAVSNRGSLRHIVVTEPGDLLGDIKAPLINFAVRHIKKIVPAWVLDGALSLSDARGKGKKSGFTPVTIARRCGGAAIHWRHHGCAQRCHAHA